MLKRILSISASVFILNGCSQIPFLSSFVGNQQDDYFPIIEGSRWEYNLFSNNSIIGTQTVTMSLVSEKEGATTAAIRSELTPITPSSGSTSVYMYSCKKSGGEVTSSDTNGDSSIILKTNMNDGSSFITNNVTYIASHEDIVVSAGSYRNTLKLTSTKDGTIEETWFARGVGNVKYRLSQNGNYLSSELSKYSKP